MATAAAAIASTATIGRGAILVEVTTCTFAATGSNDEGDAGAPRVSAGTMVTGLAEAAVEAAAAGWGSEKSHSSDTHSGIFV